MRSHQVAVFGGLAALGDVVVDLGHGGLLVGRELALGEVAQVGVGAFQELVSRRRAMDSLVVRDTWRNLTWIRMRIRGAIRSAGF